MVAEEIRRINEALPSGVRLVAVSKFRPSDAIREAYAAGQRVFGESHAQELQKKTTELAAMNDIEWHFIGHLQTNKVRFVVPHVRLIHSGDSPHLLAEINKQAVKAGCIVPCLLQLHVAREETKFGFTPDEARQFLDNGEWRQWQGVRLAGVMAMASNTDDTVRVRDDFRCARRFFEETRRNFFSADPAFCELSMGMSNDWPIAIDEGSTLIRIGTSIFG